MNTYYSNLIEGHNTRPRDIERALAGELDKDEGRRNLQLEAAAHVRVQREVDRMGNDGSLPPPALLASETPKGAVSLRFPGDALEDLFPRLYPQRSDPTR